MSLAGWGNVAAIAGFLGLWHARATVDPLPYPIHLPDGFSISTYATGLPGIRFLTLSPRGELMASIPDDGRIVLFRDRLHGLETLTFASGLDRPHGLAWRQGDLYVAETGAVVRLTPSADGMKAERRTVVTRSIPAGGMHWTRTLVFGPDGHMFVSVGSDCNVCRESDPRRAAILRFNPDGTGATIYARGIRNAVGLAWEPGTRNFWATENGRDWLGNERPPDALDRIVQGGNYGWPYCYGQRTPDPKYLDPGRCRGVVPSALDLQAHSAPLGICFYSGNQFPAGYRGDAFVAFHGSWNRQPPTGYKVVRVRFRNNRPVAYQDFATGWLRGARAWGRPVDVLVARDGSLFVSDDRGGRVYRIRYTTNAPASSGGGGAAMRSR
jgi:glucose/arabinose dehydrogenase